VSARRGWVEGTLSEGLAPGTCRGMAVFVDRADTPGMTFRLVRPFQSTTGVNTRRTPDFLKGICGWESGGGSVVSHERPFGIGNSPPATKVAVSPEIAVKLGSASVRMTPARSIARIVAETLGIEPVRKLPLIGPPLAENGLVVLKFTTAVP